MPFFTDPSEFTHYGTFYGLPVYFKDLEDDGPTIAGHNFAVDLVIEWVVPVLGWIEETFNQLVLGNECRGWAFKVKGELPKPIR